jgi:hypothetical protein
LNKSFIESYLEDTLIDLMIAFEASVFEGEDNRPRNKTMALAIAMLIGTNENERRRIRTKLLEAYPMRNRIIHSLKSEPNITTELVSEITQYFRRSIKKILGNS